MMLFLLLLTQFGLKVEGEERLRVCCVCSGSRGEKRTIGLEREDRKRIEGADGSQERGEKGKENGKRKRKMEK